MSLLLEGLHLPKEKPMAITIYKDGVWCYVYTTEYGKAVEVPEPHGRLGDLDELYSHLNGWYLEHKSGFSERERLYIRAMLLGITDAPTIIPASKEDEA